MFSNRYSVNNEIYKLLNMSILRWYATVIPVRTCDNIPKPEELLPAHRI